MPPEASHPQPAPLSRTHNDADTAAQNEMHGVGFLALPGDDLSGGNFDPLAFFHQPRGVLGSDCINQPFVQRFRFARLWLICLDDRVFAKLKRPIEVACHKNITRDQAANSEYVVNLARHIHEHQSRSASVSQLLDLPEAVRGR